MEEVMKTEATVKQTVEAIMKELKIPVPECSVTKQGDNFIVNLKNEDGVADFEVELREGGVLFLLRAKLEGEEYWEEFNEKFAVVAEDLAE